MGCSSLSGRNCEAFGQETWKYKRVGQALVFPCDFHSFFSGLTLFYPFKKSKHELFVHYEFEGLVMS